MVKTTPWIPLRSVGLLAPVRREVPGPLVLLGAGAPSPRRPLLQECLAHGAAPRLQVARLPAYAPALPPTEGLWAHLKGGDLRHGCGLTLRQVGHERRDAVKRVRRKPRRIQGCFRGAKLSLVMLGSVILQW
jgi:hypothetical protein